MKSLTATKLHCRLQDMIFFARNLSAKAPQDAAYFYLLGAMDALAAVQEGCPRRQRDLRRFQSVIGTAIETIEKT